MLQEIARFGCNTGSSARVVEQEQPRGLFDQLFEQLSGDPFEQDIREDGFGDYFDGYAGYSTVRTLCVRTCDGYYWPISYSTIPDYVVNDADQCQQQCPGSEVRLFYYNNPGQEAEQTIDTDGHALYEPAQRASSTAREFDATCTLQAADQLRPDQHRRDRTGSRAR